MAAKLMLKRGTTASWADSQNRDTTLAPGQIGIEYLDSGYSRLKVVAFKRLWSLASFIALANSSDVFHPLIKTP